VIDLSDGSVVYDVMAPPTITMSFNNQPFMMGDDGSVYWAQQLQPAGTGWYMHRASPDGIVSANTQLVHLPEPEGSFADNTGNGVLLQYQCHQLGGCVSMLLPDLSGLKGKYTWPGSFNWGAVPLFLVDPSSTMILIVHLSNNTNVVVTALPMDLSDTMWEVTLYGSSKLSGNAEVAVEDGKDYLYFVNYETIGLYKVDLQAGSIVWYQIFSVPNVPGAGASPMPLVTRGQTLVCLGGDPLATGTALACANATTGHILYTVDCTRLAALIGDSLEPTVIGGYIAYMQQNGTVFYVYDIIEDELVTTWTPTPHLPPKLVWGLSMHQLSAVGYSGYNNALLMSVYRPGPNDQDHFDFVRLDWNGLLQTVPKSCRGSPVRGDWRAIRMRMSGPAPCP